MLRDEMNSRLRSALLGFISLAAALTTPLIACAQFGPPGPPPPFDDHAEMMKKLGIKAMRPGADGNAANAYDDSVANEYMSTLPNVLKLNDGEIVSTPAAWDRRRGEIVELMEREVYGRIPHHVPKVAWRVTGYAAGIVDGIPTLTKTLVGHVDNRSHPAVNVDIQASYTVPAHSKTAVPMMIEFGFGMGMGFPAPAGQKPWTAQAIDRGWGYGTIVPSSIQPDNNHLEQGIIGLCNKGMPRKPDDWGALRAWGWGVSRLIDYFTEDKSSKVDPTNVGVEGVSRYGKAALVAEAFDPRVAAAFVASSGEGGAKLHRHIFGERVENLAGGEFYWMAGNFIKYGASDPAKTAADLPVDSHELIALCAPRPCFISYGIIEKGDPNWVDAHGAYMAGLLATPVYQLLGKHGYGNAADFLTEPMPAVKQLVGGELAWRQHDGGHDATPNWPSFLEWVSQFIAAPTLPLDRTPIKISATMPSPRMDRNSAIAHAQLVQKAAKGGIDLYFEGDSITRRWGTSDPQWKPMLDNWRANFFGWNAGDFGWGADSTQNILWRLQNGELPPVQPKVIVILAGTNNIGAGETAAEVAGGVEAIIETCRKLAPRSAIIVTALFPRNDNMAYLPTIAQANQLLGAYCERHKIHWLNVNDKLADSSGVLHDQMTVDKLHPTALGYQVWADGLKPLLTQLLGPPASTDHAPPPSGDPSLIPPRRPGQPPAR